MMNKNRIEGTLAIGNILTFVNRSNKDMFQQKRGGEKERKQKIRFKCKS